MVQSSEKTADALKIKVERGTPNRIPDLLRLIKELAAFELEPDAVIVTEDILLQDGFGPNPVFQYWVAKTDDKIVGMALTYTRYSTWKGRRCYLEDIIIQQEYRRMGIGDLLFKAVEEYAIEEGHTAICWQVLDWNQPAIDFYKKRGALQRDGWLDYFLPL